MVTERDIDDALEVVDNLERMALESADKLAERERGWQRSAVRLDADKVREVIAELRQRRGDRLAREAVAAMVDEDDDAAFGRLGGE